MTFKNIQLNIFAVKSYYISAANKKRVQFYLYFKYFYKLKKGNIFLARRKRIIFLDIMRAFAVMMMVQGHTTDALLDQSYRTFSSAGYTVWEFFRGFTAPIFMFTSGTVFTYLFKLNNLPFKDNPRVLKGLKRFLLLVFIGYLLRFPTWNIFDYSQVEEKQWQIFFVVDALHLIGFGLLFIILLNYLSEKIKLNYYITGIAGTLFFFLIYPLTITIDWPSIFPTPVAAYFTKRTGSLFPFFPWIGYILAGSVLGKFLAKKEDDHKNVKFVVWLSVIGIGFIAFSYLGKANISLIKNWFPYWGEYAFVAFFRLGMVILFNSVAALVSLRINRLPKLVAQVGTHTLLIYAVHLIILYGSAWNNGFNKYLSKQLNVSQTIIAVVLMLTAMILMVIGIEKYKTHRKKIKTNKIEAANEKV